MPRPTEIAADARALYGPPSVRPAAGDMGDGALWVDPGDSQSLWQVQSGNWRQIALPPADVDTDDDSSVPAGVPVLRGPYVVSYSDIPHDGDTLTLWTPAVGDCLLRLFPDVYTLIQWDHGTLYIGPGLAGLMSLGGRWLATADHGGIANSVSGALDNVVDGAQNCDSLGPGHAGTPSAYVAASTDPIQIQWQATGAPDATQGHVELYALIARAVAP